VARRAIYAVAALNTLAIGLLSYALITDDFSIAHVASVSSTNMRLHMKCVAVERPGGVAALLDLDDVALDGRVHAHHRPEDPVGRRRTRSPPWV
jgi:hypothetical protein